MSLKTKLMEMVDNIVEVYITNISEKYNIDKDKLEDLWKNSTINSDIKIEKKVVDDKVYKEYTENDSDKLAKLKKEDLMVLCKERKLKSGGTKQDLIKRLIVKDDDKKEVKKKVETKKVVEVKDNIIKKVENKQIVNIRRNTFNNFEHQETGFIFNEQTQKVIGKQNANGEIDSLTEDDIDTCNKYKFNYEIPFNLDEKNSDDKEEPKEKSKVEEIPNVEEELVDEIIEEEEEYEYEE